jgi:hypothetical protein
MEGVRPGQVKTRIFLDGGDPDETLGAIRLSGFLDGQTANLTLISRNPEVLGKSDICRRGSGGSALNG